MAQEMNKEIKHYFRQIKLLLPIMGKKERRFLKDFRSSVEDFLEKNPGSDIADVVERFGSPDDVMHDYISSLDQEQLCRNIHFRHLLRNAIIVILLLAAAYFIYRTCLLTIAYHQAQEKMASYIVEVIE